MMSGLMARAAVARKESPMRKMQLVLLLTVVAFLPAAWEPARGQAPIQPQILYSKQRQIAIPFDPDPAQAHRLKQVQLYYSTDQGRTWHVGAIAAPDQKKFNFLANSDGLHLFAVQTTDLAGRSFPDKMEGVTPALRVVIDTAAPIVNLKPLPPRGNEVGVAWDIQDDNQDVVSADAIRLEYRKAGGLNWLPLSRVPGATQLYWAPGSTDLFDVKIRVRDLAGNTTEATTQCSLAGTGGYGFPSYGPGGNDGAPKTGPSGVALDPGRRFINTKRVALNYEITDSGPSGISSIDLWFTNDGRIWSKYELPKASANDPTFKGPLAFDVQGEGIYGFTLIPKSGVGISAPPPQVGEKPQIWIEVDLTKLVVELKSVLVGQGTDKGKLYISWAAADKNFGNTPISLSYGATADGPWTLIYGKLPNTGSYVWTMPVGGSMPWQFFIKVEAIDLAGNIGEAITPGLVKVDTFQPKAKILDVRGGG
jgi:hypothetical protein